MQNKKKTQPRRVPNRDEKYMGLAFWIASFSKDPHTQMGSIIISEDNNPLGSGYNGPPESYDDNLLDWSRPEKYPHMIHAEVNAIRHVALDMTGATLYVTGKPCPACMLSIAGTGISRVVYFAKTFTDGGSSLNDKGEQDMTDNIAQKANIKLEKFSGNLNWMRDRMKWMEAVGIFE